MSNVNVIPDFITWLYQTLAADATLQARLISPETGDIRIYESQGTEGRSPTGYAPQWPENPDYPLVRFELHQCPHTTGNGGRRFASAPVVLIEAVDLTEDLAGMKDLANAIDALFGERAVGSQGNVHIQGSICLEDHVGTKTKDSGIFKELGATYEFFVFAS